MGTIGGNIVNASPIADSLPFLFVTESQLEVAGPQGRRTININDFYRGYRQTDLQRGEILTRVRIPIPTSKQHLSLYKVSRRRDLDIATFTAAILLDVCGGEIVEARIALGAVGPTVLRARRTEAFLRGTAISAAIASCANRMHSLARRARTGHDRSVHCGVAALSTQAPTPSSYDLTSSFHKVGIVRL